jgi:predicted nucleic acid-binding protein
VTSVITLAELLAFPDLTKGEEARLKDFLWETRVVPVDWNIAELGGFIRKTYHLKIADSLIAATAWQEATILVTRNVRDFRKVREITTQSL